jgi:hypothetical protein
MGNSTKHASTVPLVLNPETGSITAQFLVVFDDWFATVTSTENELPDLNSDEWKHMFGESTYQHSLDDDGADDSEFLGLEPLTSGHSSHSSPAKCSLSRREMLRAPLTPLALLYLCQLKYLRRWTVIPVLHCLVLQLRFATIHLLLLLRHLLFPRRLPQQLDQGDITTSSGAVDSNEGDVSTEGAIKSAAVVSSEGEYSGTADEGKSAACVHSNSALDT